MKNKLAINVTENLKRTTQQRESFTMFLPRKTQLHKYLKSI